jgi:large repetitive protein
MVTGVYGGMRLAACLAVDAIASAACGDASDPESTVGSLSGTVRNADTDSPIEGVTLVVAGIEGRTGGDGNYRIDSIPAGTQVVALSVSNYVGRMVEAEIRAGAITTLMIELAPTSNPGPPSLKVATSELPQATVDVPYEASLEANGGAPPYTWSWGSQGPPGLLLDAGGIVTGTPEFPAGTHPLRVTVGDVEGMSAFRDLIIEFVASSGLRVSSLELSMAEVGEPYADTLRAAGGAPPYTFDWLPPTDLEGLILEPATGALSGTPLRATSPDGQPDTAMVTVHDAVGASAIANAALGIRPAPLVIATEELPDGQVGVAYEADLAATGGYGNKTWTVVSGTLPPGLNVFDDQSLFGSRVAGTPTTGGTFTFTLEASDDRVQATREYTVAIANGALSIVTSTLPAALVGTPYSVFLVRDGGAGPFTWDVVSGSLPAGVSLTAAGELTGTPTAPGDASFEVRVRDAGSQSATADLTLHVNP